MQLGSVFAATGSRVHADLVVIRLKRAGISRGKISAIFPEHSKPNCASCWLDGQSVATLYSGKTVTIAGPIAEELSMHSEPTLISSLEQIGLSVNDACSFVDRLNNNQILITVAIDHESKAALVWNAFRQLEIEGIAVGLSAPPPLTKKSEPWSRSSSQRKELVTSDSAGDLGVAV